MSSSLTNRIRLSSDSHHNVQDSMFCSLGDNETRLCARPAVTRWPPPLHSSSYPTYQFLNREKFSRPTVVAHHMFRKRGFVARRIRRDSEYVASSGKQPSVWRNFTKQHVHLLVASHVSRVFFFLLLLFDLKFCFSHQHCRTDVQD